ncbi:hypothetical protein BDY21DRAFT_342137 [Lineolata rhizophorae]|uniref:Uncharacterized protein n=1 Tax=Lineolata rhizophorae TaxID=578093 RepID=A0A6A6P3I0_9PEZI|nr:hypothetical protein BDY21DRAFT_342137 [Lineolata rhizophorae]
MGFVWGWWKEMLVVGGCLIETVLMLSFLLFFFITPLSSCFALFSPFPYLSIYVFVLGRARVRRSHRWRLPAAVLNVGSWLAFVPAARRG